ncbi:tetratricopeptide repeat protein [Rhodoblastus acidophilus]|uniref:Tetratricopeptide repeat protein n=1 Tax=Candidatus Rhodoblastus alkanivorans TaxID=2954117 RepID=A0ABS9Z8T5_9HYPH|nr:tetratricopeptide repeat protein [Candidatus Rhodoblastus alkanivorans]MCI4677894.1 tetratricopeptide repeat protein [Candidatus Rhodoblastus alkanivorans]MCI4683790.1 tetratricopeptide repeat protein [Candidatus Rhodoblastus alkanivorans]MDI4641108.1 tetratricopeptide repeat protein [Rhodoblastus acidophilus]
MKFPVWLLAIVGAIGSCGVAFAQNAPSGEIGGPQHDPLLNLMVPRILPETQTKRQSAAAEACADAGGKSDAQTRAKACGVLIRSGHWKGEEIAWAYSNRCFALFRLGQRDNALLDCDKAIALDGKNAVAFQARGMIEQDGGASDKALADFDKAVELGAKNAAIFSDRGNLLLAKGETDKALADYDRAVALNGGSANAYVERAGAWLAKGEPDKAIADYDKATALAPKDAFTVFNRGVAFYLKGDKAKAGETWRQALKLDPSNAYPALWLFLAGEGAAEKAALKKHAANFSHGAWPWPVVQYDLGAIDAEKLLAVARTPGNRCEAQFYLGAGLLAKKARDEAAAHWRQATDICPKNFVEYFGAVAGLKALGVETPKAEKAPQPTPTPAAEPPSKAVNAPAAEGNK